MDDYGKVFADKKVIMVVTAHPDDLDAMCGGTVARLTDDGKRVISIKTTTGNNGSRDSIVSSSFLAKKRKSEDNSAMKKLGIESSDSISLGLDDGSIENTKDLIERLSFYIRKFQPDIVITLNPENTFIDNDKTSWVNHRDHPNTAGATVDALYPFSRDRSFFKHQFDDKTLRPSHCNELLLADYCRGSTQVKIKIDDFTDQKQAALESHTSQFDKTAVQKVLKMYNQHYAEGTFETFRHITFN